MSFKAKIISIILAVFLFVTALTTGLCYAFNSTFKKNFNSWFGIENKVENSTGSNASGSQASNSDVIDSLRNELLDSQIKLNKLNNELNSANEKLETFSNENLIINGNFTINQKEKSVYERVGEDIYTADRWGIFKGNGRFTVATHTLEALDETSPTVFGQWIENAYCLVGNDITVSATLNDVRYSKTVSLPKTYVYEENFIENIFECDEFIFRIYFYVDYNVEKSILGVQFILQNGNTLKIDKVKVEEASFETRYVERFIPEEMSLCQRYFQRVNPTSVGYGLNETSIVFFAPTPVTLRVAPKVSVGTAPSIFKDGEKITMDGEIKLQSRLYNSVQLIYKPTGGGVIKNGSYQINTGNIYLDGEYYTNFTI